MGAQQTDPLHILLFEDNPADADLVAEYLDLSPLTTLLTVCKRLQEGLATLRNSCFEVVLLDLSLPDSKGLQTLDAVREFCADCAVIVLTGTDDEALSLRALHAGAQDYLVKDSLNSDSLSRSIRYAVERAALSRQISRDRAELSQREHLLRLIFDASTEPMLILSDDYTIRFFNPTAQRLLDAGEDELIGETFPFAINPDQGTELEIPEADGGSRLVELTSRELIWEGESGILVILRDVTDRSRSENELKLERQRLQAALDSIQEGILITDAAGRIERANHEACRLSGNEWPGIAGQPLSQVLRLRDAENGTPLRDPCRELLHRDSIETYRQKGLELEAADGSKRRLVSAICRPIEDTSGTHCGCVTVLRDFTKDKKAEEELFRMEKLNSVSLLAGGIAHDFNNILTAILGNISVVRLQMPEEDENSQRLLNAENAAVQLNR